MKTLNNYHLNPSNNTLTGNQSIRPLFTTKWGRAGAQTQGKRPQTINPYKKIGQTPPGILTEAAAEEMASGRIPDLEQICRELNDSFNQGTGSDSALKFIPILKKLSGFDAAATERFLKNPKTSHVLVQNEKLKVVLIHWVPGKFSSIHGHAQGGCVFKVLKGRLQEKRYTPDEAQQLLAVSNFENQGMAYIDDEMAYHAVGNPFDQPAISLHAYTPGR